VPGILMLLFVQGVSKYANRKAAFLLWFFLSRYMCEYTLLYAMKVCRRIDSSLHFDD
jgi:hypothetical protein